MKKGFLLTVLFILLAIVTVKVDRHIKSKQIRDGIVIQASREAQISGIWLGLYKNKRFKFGYFGFLGVDIDVSGIYQIKNDTLTLSADSGTENIQFKENLRFLVLKNALMELPKDSGGIGYLEIWKDK